MFLVNNQFFLLSLPFSFFTCFYLCSESGVSIALVGVLLYFGFYHFLVQYWYAKYILVGKIRKSEKVPRLVFFSCIAVLVPLSVIVVIYDIDVFETGVYVILFMLLQILFIYFTSKYIFSYFSSLEDSSKWGSKFFVGLYFSRYPPEKKSDIFVMDFIFYMLIMVVLLKLFF